MKKRSATIMANTTTIDSIQCAVVIYRAPLLKLHIVAQIRPAVFTEVEVGRKAATVADAISVSSGAPKPSSRPQTQRPSSEPAAPDKIITMTRAGLKALQ